MVSYYGAFLMLFVLLGTKQTTNGNCLNKYSMKSHQTFSSNNNIQNGTISGWINIDKISWHCRSNGKSNFSMLLFILLHKPVSMIPLILVSVVKLS